MDPVRRCQTASGPGRADAPPARLRQGSQSSKLTPDLRGASPAGPLPRARSERATRERARPRHRWMCDPTTTSVTRPKRSRRRSPLNRLVWVSRSPSPARRTRHARTGRASLEQNHRLHGRRSRRTRGLVLDMLGAIVTGHPDRGRRGERHRQDLGEASASCGRPADGRCRQHRRWRACSAGVREQPLEASRRSRSSAYGMADR